MKDGSVYDNYLKLKSFMTINSFKFKNILVYSLKMC